MKILRYGFIQFKRMIKDIKVIGFMLIMPLVVINIINFAIKSGGGSTIMVDVAFNVEDTGKEGKQLLQKVKIPKKSIFYNNKNKAMESLNKNDVMAIYEIPKDFSKKIKKGEKPEIKAYKKEIGNGTLPIENSLNNNINKKVKENLLINKNIIKSKNEIDKNNIKTVIENTKNVEDGVFLVISLIINFIIFSANNVSSEILNFKKQNILKRAITTSNRGFEIIGGIYMGMILIQIFIYMSVYVCGKFIVGYSFENLFFILINTMVASIFSISFGVFVTRLFQNESVVALVVNIIGISTTFLSLYSMGLSMSKPSWILLNIGKLTPQYWIFDSIKNSSIFPNIFIVMLMSLVLFTAGNIKVRDFATN
ncbi:ABC transporter permease [Clostridium sporogenes]|uniref:ABC transporter permease n=1 Tax=Clostridium botulinum TaxID=1491 RepID=A0A6M0T3B6_CLOBO|nr:ABC transporter permease [Clostridium sporogenes]NFA61460.1 ABC transporter permease [Clostridium botulinum]NFI72438.1 ABC transporter permease [Clostridium sporogenes]NFM24217.1 ABC transporter permease [Clostridium sporogenes]NFP60714.1 ABC transporter permease [Clostridium sporogenes]NFU93733.1 ABC transporter permease [Clostridium sporogenes]